MNLHDGIRDGIGVARLLPVLVFLTLSFLSIPSAGWADECMGVPSQNATSAGGEQPQCGDNPTPLPPPPPPRDEPPPPPPDPSPQPPPPQPPPPQPPAPAPAPTDSDGDGTPNSSDNCPYAHNDQADHDYDGTGDVCDPTPFQGEMAPGGSTYEAFEASTPSDGATTVTAQRCKTQKFTQRYDQFGASFLNFIRYEGGFRVCYVPSERIVSWGSVWGDATYVRLPWDWKGNDGGYPYGARTGTHSVEFHYRGSAAICAVGWACGPTKHPGVTITFYDNNTMTVRAYVV